LQSNLVTWWSSLSQRHVTDRLRILLNSEGHCIKYEDWRGAQKYHVTGTKYMPQLPQPYSKLWDTPGCASVTTRTVFCLNDDALCLWL